MKKVNLTLILLIVAYNIASAGLYFIELPNTITDDMYFHQSDDVRIQLKQLIDRELEGKNEDIAVVVFTRNGEPVRPSTTVNEQINNKKEMKSSKELSEENYIEFLWINRDPPDVWTQTQIDDMRWFLYDVSTGGDDHGIYNFAKKLYGPPFFDSEENNYKVELYLDANMSQNVKAIWIPPTYWADWSDIGHGKLYLKYYPANPDDHSSAADDSRGVLAKAMLMLFWGPFYNTFDQFLSGMPYAGGTILMNYFATIFINFNDLFHGEKTEERPGFIFYENYNQPAISCQNINGTRFNDVDLRSYLAPYRFQMAEMAWFKVYQESDEKTYFQEFNKKMYDYGMEDVHYIPPEYGELCKMAEGAWGYSSSKPGPEGFDTFDDWRNKQYVLTSFDLRKYQLGVFSDANKLRVCLYKPRNIDDKYVEEYISEEIFIHVMVYDGNNTYVDRDYFVGGSTNIDHFEVNMPLLQSIEKISCAVNVVNDEKIRIRFDKPLQYMDVIGGIPQLRPKLAGIIPPDNTKFNFQGKSLTVWTLKDPNGMSHFLDIQDYAYVYNDPNYPNGLEGVYELYADGELYKKFTKDKEIFFDNACYDPSGYEDYDKNNNGVRDEYEEPLVQKFAPILLFHNNNYLRPIQAEVYLDCYDVDDYSELYYNYLINSQGIPTGDRFDRIVNENLQEPWESYFNRAKEHGNDPDIWGDDGDWALKLKAMDPDTSYWFRYYMTEHGGFPEYANVVYYHFFHTNYSGTPDIYDETYIQFWFFYIYNLWDFDNHQGDWETVIVKLDCQIPESANPLAFNYHYHKEILFFDRSSPFWNKVWGTYSGERRFEVFVGGHGDSIPPLSNEELKNIQFYTDLWGEMSGASYPHPDDLGNHWSWWVWWGPIPWHLEEEVEGTEDNPFRLFYPDCISAPTENPNEHPFIVVGPYKYCQLNVNTDNLIQGELQEADPMWLIYPGRWGYYCYWYGDCPRGPYYNGFPDDRDWERWTDENIMASEEYPEYVKNPTEMKKLDEMNNSPSSISNPYSLNSSGGYNINSELATVNNTTNDISIYPNPCSISAVISVPQKLSDNNNEPITISIYDISGRLVRKEITTSSFTWDLTSSNGEPVSNGIYLVNISTTKENKTLKLLVAR